jgi:hypothetical protein
MDLTIRRISGEAPEVEIPVRVNLKTLTVLVAEPINSQKSVAVAARVTPKLAEE